MQDMDQQLSVARMKIIQLTAEVQGSKQAAQHHEEKTVALQAQVCLLLLLTAISPVPQMHDNGLQ